MRGENIGVLYHLTLYPKYVQFVSLVYEGYFPLQRIQDKCSFHV